MRKKISALEAKTRAVERACAAARKLKPIGCVAAATAAPIEPRPAPPTPTEAQATIAWKIFCSSPHSSLKTEAEEIVRRYLRADLNEKAPVRTSGYAYIPSGGTLTTTGGDGACVWGVG